MHNFMQDFVGMSNKHVLDTHLHTNNLVVHHVQTVTEGFYLFESLNDHSQMKAFNPPKRRGKSQKGRIGGTEQNQEKCSFGRYAIRACECTRLTPSTIEAVRRTLTRFLKRKGKIWVCIYPDIAVTEKPLEMRMGKGKGSISSWIFRVKAGQNLFEMEGVSHALAKQAALRASYRLPIKSRFCLSDM